jgi:hypothetical protein
MAATTTITRRTELAHRASDGIDVYLFWNEPTSGVTVGVLDARGDDSFEFDVDGRDALDAFNHPYAYAGRPGATRQRPTGTTVNSWRTDDARTDR